MVLIGDEAEYELHRRQAANRAYYPPMPPPAEPATRCWKCGHPYADGEQVAAKYHNICARCHEAAMEAHREVVAFMRPRGMASRARRVEPCLPPAPEAGATATWPTGVINF